MSEKRQKLTISFVPKNMTCFAEELSAGLSGKSGIVTYSPSTTIALTHACMNRCLYCNFREDGDGLVEFKEIEETARRAHHDRVSEVLLISGQSADQVPTVRRGLESRGVRSMVRWTKTVCEYLLGEDLLPHVNIGVLSNADLAELREVSASMGLMMEGDYGNLGARIHPEKSFSLRVRNLEWAGLLKIPFTTGILFGLGEKQEDRIRSLEIINSCCETYGHVQEIILQNYVPDRKNSPIPSQKISFEEIAELIHLCKEAIPGVSIQVPPNLNSKWPELLVAGVTDLGGISKHGDLINPGNPWPSVKEIKQILKRKNYRLKKRLPIYPGYYQQGWYSERVGKVIEKWVMSGNEYRYYIQRNSQG